MSNYMDLEFYDKELTDSKRTLIALSNFLKDKIDPALFARAYHQIITTGYAENSIPLEVSASNRLDLADKIKRIFREKNIYILSYNKEDIEQCKKVFLRWKDKPQHIEAPVGSGVV